MTPVPDRAGDIGVVHFETIDSTNAEALRCARRSEAGPLWIVADRQEAGRGRRGRSWISEPGNLYATLYLVDPAPPAVVPGVCFVAAVALHDALLDAVHGLAPVQLSIKWPNDLLLNGRKVAGILVEGMSLDAGRSAVAVGFGVNCRRHPAGPDVAATSLAEAGFAVTPGALLAALGTAMARRIGEWDRGAGFDSIRSAWLARARGVGGPIEVRLPDRTLAGTFETVDARGALVLLRPDGVREAIAAGDVFPLSAA